MDSGLRGPFLVNGRYWAFVRMHGRILCYCTEHVMGEWRMLDKKHSPKAKNDGDLGELIVSTGSTDPDRFEVWYTAPDGFMGRAYFDTVTGRWATNTEVTT